jgi:Ser-tRNA(Ala) deacylase AlaX
MAFMNKGQNKEKPAPTALEMTTGDEELDAVLLQQKLQAAADEEKKKAVDPSKRYFIMREVRIDAHNIRRFRVQLTPSMCQVRGCQYDAASMFGGWNKAPIDQELPNGQTVKQKIMNLLKAHVESGHVIETSHIMSEDELAIHKNAASLPQGFLAAAS